MPQWLWIQKQDIGPAQRYGHAMAYDSEHKLVVLFGGEALNYVYRNDTWAWDGQIWTRWPTWVRIRVSYTAWHLTVHVNGLCCLAVRQSTPQERYVGVGRRGVDSGGRHGSESTVRARHNL